MAFRLMVFNSELRRDPSKWRTLLTKRTGSVREKKWPSPVCLTMLCILPILSAMVSSAQKGALSPPVTTRVRAAPFIFGGFYKTNEETCFVLTTPCSIVFGFIKRPRLTHLLNASGSSCLVNGRTARNLQKTTNTTKCTLFPPIFGTLAQASWCIHLTRSSPKTPQTFISVLIQGAPFTMRSAGILLCTGKRNKLGPPSPHGPPPLASAFYRLWTWNTLCYPSPPTSGTWPKSPLPTLQSRPREVQWLPRNLTPPTRPKDLPPRATHERPVTGRPSRGKGMAPYRVLVCVAMLSPFYELS